MYCLSSVLAGLRNSQWVVYISNLSNTIINFFTFRSTSMYTDSEPAIICYLHLIDITVVHPRGEHSNQYTTLAILPISYNRLAGNHPF